MIPCINSSGVSVSLKISFIWVLVPSSATVIVLLTPEIGLSELLSVLKILTIGGVFEPEAIIVTTPVAVFDQVSLFAV